MPLLHVYAIYLIDITVFYHVCWEYTLYSIHSTVHRILLPNSTLPKKSEKINVLVFGLFNNNLLF